ncbi:hypothetical protein AB6H97_003716 [Providencia rettgeri]
MPITNALTKPISLSRTASSESLIQNNDTVSSNISSISSPGIAGKLPVSTEKTSNADSKEFSMSKETLHASNIEAQANNIIKLLRGKLPNITPEAVKKILSYTNFNNLEAQKLTYCPAGSLILLTLLRSNEVTEGLLDSAAKMVEHLINKGDKADNSLYKLDRELTKTLSSISNDSIVEIQDRFKERYIRPSFETLLKTYLPMEVIDKIPMESFLLSQSYQQKQERILTFKNSHQNDISSDNKKPPVDKACYVSEIFCALEESLEILRTLKVSVHREGRPSTVNTKLPKVPASDEVDGPTASPQPASTPSNPIAGIHNTTINNYFYLSCGENIQQVSNQEKENDDVLSQRVEAFFANHNRNATGLDHRALMQPKDPFITETILSTSSSEPDVDYDMDNAKDQENTEVKQPIIEKPVTASNKVSPLNNTSLEPQDSSHLIRTEALEESRLPSGEKSIEAKPKTTEFFINTQPKNDFTVNRYQKDENNHWVLKKPDAQKPVTLTANGALTRNQSDKEVYRGEREATKVVVDTSSHLPNAGSLVTLTERGALTRGQAEKERYAVATEEQMKPLNGIIGYQNAATKGGSQ